MMTLSMKETCKRLGISYSKARYAVDRGDIPTVRIGRTLRVPEALLAKKWDSSLDDERSTSSRRRPGGAGIAHVNGELSSTPTRRPRPEVREHQWRGFLEAQFSRCIRLRAHAARRAARSRVTKNPCQRRQTSLATVRGACDRIEGKGAGLPQGLITASGTITVPKVTGQAPGTVIAENISSMWSRLPAPCRKRAVWLVNEDISQQLELIGTGSPSSIGLYMGPDGTPLLKGRPVVEVEQCPPTGTPGDIILADLSQYVIIETGVQTAVSMDVSYDTDESVFRFKWRGDGRPLWTTPITPFNGSGLTRSPYVILSQR